MDIAENTEQPTQNRVGRCIGWRGCCSFPHGRNTLIAFIFSIATSILVRFGSSGCNLYRVDETFIHDLYDNTPHGLIFVPHDYGVGPDTRQNIHKAQIIESTGFRNYTHETRLGAGCEPWSRHETEAFFDGAMSAGMAFAIITSFAISFGGILLLAMSCCANPCGLYCFHIEYTKGCISLSYALAAITQLLTYIVFSSEMYKMYNGKISAGSYFLALGVISSTAIAFLIRPVNPAKHVENIEDGAVNSHSIENDGDIVVETLPEETDLSDRA